MTKIIDGLKAHAQNTRQIIAQLVEEEADAFTIYMLADHLLEIDNECQRMEIMQQPAEAQEPVVQVIRRVQRNDQD